MPGQQRLVEQGRVAVSEGAEVSYGRIGRDVVRDEPGPGDRDRFVVLVRRAVASRDLLDPLAQPARRVALLAGRDEREVDVLAVAEPPASANLGLPAARAWFDTLTAEEDDKR